MATIQPSLKLYYGNTLTSNYPELNCCACGKTACVNTPNWTNGYFGCDVYESLGLCKNGLVNKYTSTGENSNYPELNCCACGKTGGVDESKFLFLLII